MYFNMSHRGTDKGREISPWGQSKFYRGRTMPTATFCHWCKERLLFETDFPHLVERACIRRSGSVESRSVENRIVVNIHIASLIKRKLYRQIHHQIGSCPISSGAFRLYDRFTPFLNESAELFDDVPFRSRFVRLIVLDPIIAPVIDGGRFTVLMIYLIHIGIKGRRPRGRPHGKTAAGELVKSSGVGNHLDLPAVLIENLARFQKSRVSGVIGGIAGNRKRIFQRFAVFILPFSVCESAPALLK